MRKLWTGIFCGVALLGGALSLSAAEGSGGPSSTGLCFRALEPVQQPLWLTSPGCYQQMDCWDDELCREQCPTATTAVCVNEVCRFWLPGSSGPIVSGCPEQRDCADASHCVYSPGGITGSCVNDVCVC